MSVPRPNGRGQADRISVPCGKCIICLKNRRSHWSFRLEQEFLSCLSAYFITLTYDDYNLPLNTEKRPTLKKRDLSLFLKSLRQWNNRDAEKYEKLMKVSKNSLKKGNFMYYACGEYGERTLRPHYHLILFNLNTWFPKDTIEKKVFETWSKGLVHVGSVTPASISYVAKYLVNSYNMDFTGIEKPFSVMSKGIGLSYIEKTRSFYESTGETVIHDKGGIKKSMPRYFRKKLNIQSTDIMPSTDSYMVNGRDERTVILENLKKSKPKKSKL